MWEIEFFWKIVGFFLNYVFRFLGKIWENVWKIVGKFGGRRGRRSARTGGPAGFDLRRGPQLCYFFNVRINSGPNFN